MRSPAELMFRTRQELGNLWLLARRPSPALDQLPEAPLAGLPEPARVAELLRGTAYAREVERLAAGILERRFPLLGVTVETGPDIPWRRDVLSGIETRPAYFRRIPYLDHARAGDHKSIWELSRHQHLVLLAQAFLLTGRDEFLRDIPVQWESWSAANPFLRSINWTSAVEVAFRALSWIWVYHLAGRRLAPDFRNRFLTALYRHGCYLERNLSVYYSPNTHLLGEAVALHALGALFPAFPGAERWKAAGSRIVLEQMDRQVHADGSHFEHSAYYHVYALDFFLFHAVLSGTPPPYREKLALMARFADALQGPSRRLPLLGDDDGGRVFHPYGERDGFARASVATCSVLLGTGSPAHRAGDLHEQAAWWIGERALDPAPTAEAGQPESVLFPDCGVAVLRAADAQVVVDAGPFGPAGGGHSHSDTLSLVVRAASEEILSDAGTFTYVGDPAWRDWFRGSSAHNTIRVDQRDQAVPAGPFRWAGAPEVEVKAWSPGPAGDYIDAVCRYGGVAHRRRVLLLKPDLIFVLDEVTGPPGQHLVEQFWHPGAETSLVTPFCYRIGSAATLVIQAAGRVEFSQGQPFGWRSRAFAQREPAPVVRVERSSAFPVLLAAVLSLRSGGDAGSLALLNNGPGVTLDFQAARRTAVQFAESESPGWQVLS